MEKRQNIILMCRPLSSAFSCPVASGGYMISLLRVCDLSYATLHIYDAGCIEQ